MASDRRERKRRKSTARRRAEEHQSGGFSGTMLNLPDGLRFWSPGTMFFKANGGNEALNGAQP